MCAHHERPTYQILRSRSNVARIVILLSPLGMGNENLFDASSRLSKDADVFLFECDDLIDVAIRTGTSMSDTIPFIVKNVLEAEADGIDVAAVIGFCSSAIPAVLI